MKRLETMALRKGSSKGGCAWGPQSSSLLERLRLPEGKAEPGSLYGAKEPGIFIFEVMTLGKNQKIIASKLFEDGGICQECCLAPWPTSIFFV